MSSKLLQCSGANSTRHLLLLCCSCCGAAALLLLLLPPPTPLLLLCCSSWWLMHRQAASHARQRDTPTSTKRMGHAMCGVLFSGRCSWQRPPYRRVRCVCREDSARATVAALPGTCSPAAAANLDLVCLSVPPRVAQKLPCTVLAALHRACCSDSGATRGPFPQVLQGELFLLLLLLLPADVLLGIGCCCDDS